MLFLVFIISSIIIRDQVTHEIFSNNLYSFSYVVMRVQFAPNDRSLLATCGRDGILAICQVLPTPATIIYRLKGHTGAINGVFRFTLCQ